MKFTRRVSVTLNYSTADLYFEVMNKVDEELSERSYQDNEQHRIDEREGLFQTREGTMNRVDSCIMIIVGTVINLNKNTDTLRTLTYSSCRLILMC